MEDLPEYYFYYRCPFIDSLKLNTDQNSNSKLIYLKLYTDLGKKNFSKVHSKVRT